MKSHQINCQVRDASIKGRKLRREGFIPAVIYGKHFGVKNVKFDKRELTKFMNNNTVGSKVTLNVDGEPQLVMVKDFNHGIMNQQIEHVDFQALTAGEKVKVNVPISFIGKEKLSVELIVQELIQDIEIETLPKDLIDYIEVDLSECKLGDEINVEHLDIMKNEKITVLTSPDTTIAIITQAKKYSEEEEQEPEEPEFPEIVEE